MRSVGAIMNTVRLRRRSVVALRLEICHHPSNDFFSLSLSFSWFAKSFELKNSDFSTVCLFPSHTSATVKSSVVTSYSVNGGGKVDHMGGSIVGLRLSMSSVTVLTNWPA